MILKSKNSTLPYTNIKNHIIDNEDLSIEARFTLIWLLRKPADWEIIKSYTIKKLGVGRDKLNKIFNELIEAGHIVQSQKRHNGRFLQCTHMVYEDPIDKKPGTEIPETELPKPENNPLINTETKNYSIEKNTTQQVEHEIQLNDLPKMPQPEKAQLLGLLKQLSIHQAFGILASFKLSKTPIKNPVAWFRFAIKETQNSRFNFPTDEQIREVQINSYNRYQTSELLERTVNNSINSVEASEINSKFGDFSGLRNIVKKSKIN